MITGIIAAFLVFIILPVTLNNGETGPAILAVVLAVFALIFGVISRADDRAHMHRMWYWAKSGKDRARARLRWEEEARAEEERERREWMERVEAKRKRAEYRERLRSGEETLAKAPSHVCHYCGRMVRAVSMVVQTGEGLMVEYNCPRCGMLNRTKLGA